MPAFAQGERSPPAVPDNFGTAFITSGAARAEGNIAPDFRLDNELSLSEQLALAIHEQRFADAKRIKAAMISEQDLEQQLALAVKDERFDDCIRFCEAIAIAKAAKAKDGQGHTKTPNRLYPQSKMEPRSPTTFQPAVEISDDVLRAAQLAPAYDNPPIRPLPIKQERYSDITPDIQDALIARWFQETQLHDRETARSYLMTARWQFDAVLDQYTYDINQWITQTQVNDVRAAATYIRHWQGDVPEAVAAWKRRDPGRQLGAPISYQQGPTRYAQGPLPACGLRSSVAGDHLPPDASRHITALITIARGRRHFESLSSPEKAEYAKEMERNFKPDSVLTFFELPPHAQVAGPHRDFILSLVGQIEALGGCHPLKEPLVLMWMMKHYEKEVAVQWKIAYDVAHKNERTGRRIEYIIQVLSKAYANPIAASMAREALDNFQWLPTANVQMVQSKFAALQNMHESAVEDTRFNEGLERVDQMSTKEWMLLLMKVCPRYVSALYVDHKLAFLEPATMFAFVIQREALEKPTGAADNLGALSSRDNAAAMQALLQEDSDLLDRIYMSDDVTGLLALVRPDVECYRYKGAHYKWQCTATPSPQE
jgi:hypothetical protein